MSVPNFATNGQYGIMWSDDQDGIRLCGASGGFGGGNMFGNGAVGYEEIRIGGARSYYEVGVDAVIPGTGGGGAYTLGDGVLHKGGKGAKGIAYLEY